MSDSGMASDFGLLFGSTENVDFETTVSESDSEEFEPDLQATSLLEKYMAALDSSPDPDFPAETGPDDSASRSPIVIVVPSADDLVFQIDKPESIADPPESEIQCETESNTFEKETVQHPLKKQKRETETLELFLYENYGDPMDMYDIESTDYGLDNQNVKLNMIELENDNLTTETTLGNLAPDIPTLGNLATDIPITLDPFVRSELLNSNCSRGTGASGESDSLEYISDATKQTSVDGKAKFKKYQLSDLFLYEYFEKFEVQAMMDDDVSDEDTCHEIIGIEGTVVKPTSDKTQAKKSVKKYKCLENRKRKENGQPYVTRKGISKPARRVQPPCSCIRKCHMKFDEEIRSKLLSSLIRLQFGAQNQCLMDHMRVGFPKRPRVVINSRKTFMRRYFLPSPEGPIQVCRLMFLNTFDVTAKKVNILKNSKSNKITSAGRISSEDQRQNTSANRKISEESKNFVDSHIASIPAYDSHYTREKSSKRYLSSDLSIAKLYELYEELCKEKKVKAVSKTTYRTIFKTHNLSFRKPQLDTCNESDEFKHKLKIANDDEKLAIMTARNEHHDRAQNVYRVKHEDVMQAKLDEKVRTISFDLQKCLPTPNLTCGKSYYCRTLYTLNLTTFETIVETNVARCYMWDESIARRGAQEIASCVYRNLKGIPKSVLRVNLFSDRCGGQNLNFVICSMFSLFIEECVQNEQELTICHKFMVTGHSHMEVDTIHGTIEKLKKKSNVDIEIPQQWVTFIRSIRKKIPIDVVEMEQTDFLAFKLLNERYKRPKTNQDGKAIRFQKIMVFEYRTSSPRLIHYKYDVSDEDFQVMRISLEEMSAELPEIPQLETEPIPLPQEKLEDLRKLLPYITHKEYYETFLKSLVPKKRGRRGKNDAVDHFEADLDVVLLEDGLEPEEEPVENNAEM